MWWWRAGQSSAGCEEEVVHLPLLFLCGSDMWGCRGLRLLRHQIEEVNAIKIEERGGNKSSPNRNSERPGKAQGWTPFPAGFGDWDFSLKDSSDQGKTPPSGKCDTCYLPKGRHASIPTSTWKDPWEDGEDASRGFVFLFRPPGLATTADEAGATVVLYTQIPIEGVRLPMSKCASAHPGCINPCRKEVLT